MLFPSRRRRRWAQAWCWSGPAQLARGGATEAVSSGAWTGAMRSWSIERGDALQQTWGHDACCAERESRYIRLRGSSWRRGATCMHTLTIANASALCWQQLNCGRRTFRGERNEKQMDASSSLAVVAVLALVLSAPKCRKPTALDRTVLAYCCALLAVNTTEMLLPTVSLSFSLLDFLLS
jgi:hypothetical protein